jgi:hypothetical protein
MHRVCTTFTWGKVNETIDLNFKSFFIDMFSILT